MSTNLPDQPLGQGSSDLPAPVSSSAGRRAVPQLEAASFDDDWGRYLASINRFKWLIVLLALVGTTAGVIWARMAKPTYRARATIWVDYMDRRGRVDAGPIPSGEPMRSSARVDLMRSPAVLEPVVRDLRLYLLPETAADRDVLSGFEITEVFQPGVYRVVVREDGHYGLTGGTRNELVEEGTLGDSIGTGLGFAWAPTAEALRASGGASFTLVSIQEAMRKLTESMRVDTTGGNFMHLDLTGLHPQSITDAVNAIADEFVEVAVALKRQRLTEVKAILADAQQEAERNVRRAEVALNSFLVRNADLLVEARSAMTTEGRVTRDPSAAALFDARVTQASLRRDRQAIERVLLAAADSELSVAALEAIPSVRNSSEMMSALGELSSKRVELRTLRLRYTDNSPQVRRVLEEVEGLEAYTIPELGRVVISSLMARERELTVQAQSASSVLRELPPIAIEEMRLRRELESAETHFMAVQARAQEANLAELSSPTDARVLDHASTPTRPVGGGLAAPLMVMVAFLASLGTGAVGAVVLDRLDPKLHYPDQVSSDLGLQILGALPRVDRRHGAEARATAQVVEALRGIRLNLVHAYGAAGPLVVTITSPGSGDGKSFLASNLALAFAESGHRTLLIDADIRRGALHKALGAKRQPGLTDYLSGEASREEIVQSTQYPSVFFISSGTRMQAAPELLTSPTMSQFLMSVRSSYSVILVDTAPLAAGVDSLALGTLSGSMLLVLRKGSTDLDLAQAKLDALERLPIRLLGAVLNDIDAGRGDRHYGHYYYLPGYEARDEEPDAARSVSAGAQSKT